MQLSAYNADNDSLRRSTLCCCCGHCLRKRAALGAFSNPQTTRGAGQSSQHSLEGIRMAWEPERSYCPGPISFYSNFEKPALSKAAGSISRLLVPPSTLTYYIFFLDYPLLPPVLSLCFISLRPILRALCSTTTTTVTPSPMIFSNLHSLFLAAAVAVSS